VRLGLLGRRNRHAYIKDEDGSLLDIEGKIRQSHFGTSSYLELSFSRCTTSGHEKGIHFRLQVS
jgi:hypothetical protein